ncbi:hypothetical protein H6G54_21120 [Anabaena cylindrica FACHB-243]|uniref:hypothetical protein n=1 Tax=Anabaena TaxID=1163 RepID=UPI0002F843B6|nr:MULTISPECIES: hypothetical protein [Anabaena]MBD2420158.1 hypothetical protein [Anabaena cylindrica FACHB-243]MBY5282183.1 hypothetical protein [Anabaena sp. CCAP 1446/1C]MBY5309428.1 hypothetical protein [Anabaena sp. CCAP 1446/1C]MCM2409275.1 hypothetical protein [Anabaena sp. CCAP 1446/1C]
MPNCLTSPFTYLTPKLNLTAALEKRFANLGDFQLPEITREPMKTAFNLAATAV